MATNRALILALSLSAACFAAPGMVHAQQPVNEPAIKVSKEASKAINELKAAVDAKDFASVPARVAAAQAVAKTAEDRLVIAKFQVQAASDQKDYAGMAAGIDAMIASGAASPSSLPTLYTNLGKVQYNAKQYDKAAAAFEKVLATDPNNGEALSLLAETRFSQGRSAEAVGIIDRAIKAKAAAGQKPEDAVYKRAVGIAYKAKLPTTMDLARQWVTAYPTQANWRDAIGTYRNLRRPEDGTLLDVMRLAAAAGGLSGDRDHYVYAMSAIEASAPAEAERLISAATAAKAINASDPMFKEVAEALKGARGIDAASLSASAKEVTAAPTGRPALRVADGFYGLGEYAKAAEMYRVALGKSQVSKNTVNLRLGAALAQAGDKAGATAAFNAVTGPESELAKFWLVYLATKA